MTLMTAGIAHETTSPSGVEHTVYPGPQPLRNGDTWPELIGITIAEAKQWLLDNGYSSVLVVEDADDDELVCGAVVAGPTNCCGYIKSYRSGGSGPSVTLTACGDCTTTVYTANLATEECWPGDYYPEAQSWMGPWSASMMPGKYKSGTGATTWGSGDACGPHALLDGLDPSTDYRFQITIACKYSRSVTFKLLQHNAADAQVAEISIPMTLVAQQAHTFTVEFTTTADYDHMHGSWPTFLAPAAYNALSVCEL